MVAMFESRMDGQARFQASRTACFQVAAVAKLFLQTFKDRIFASSAEPVDNRSGDAGQGERDRDHFESAKEIKP